MAENTNSKSNMRLFVIAYTVSVLSDPVPLLAG